VTKYHHNRKTISKRLTNDTKWNDSKIATVWLDDQISAIVSQLHKMGVYDNTIIVLISDHNIEPGKATCYEAGVRAPLIIKWTNNNHAGERCNSFVQNIDIFPTIAEACGLSLPENIDGESFIPIINKETTEIREDMYFEIGLTRGIKTNDFKYIAFRYPKYLTNLMKERQASEAPNHLNATWGNQAYSAMRFYSSYWDPDQLFDLRNDPNEQNNLANNPEYASVLKEMKQKLMIYLKDFDHPFPLEDYEFMHTPQFDSLAFITQEKYKKIGD